MSISTLLIIFTYSTVFITTIAPGVHTRFERGYHNCGYGEQYSDSGKDCLTCQNYNNTTCPLTQEEKCYCIDNFVRDSQDRCINKTDCSKACKSHEHYTDTPACEYTCGTTDYKQWSSQCLATGCVCDKGYVRCLEKNACVLQDQCYPVCGPNEVISYNRCEPYCRNQTVIIDESCRKMLVTCEARCICKVDEFIRSEETGECIHSSDCSPANLWF